MKFLKSIIAIVALLTIVSVDAKQMKRKEQPATQPMTQPVVTEKNIRDFIDQLFNDRYDEMADVILMNFDEQESSRVINDIMQIIANEFPMNIPTAKKIFNEEMDGFCESIKGQQFKMAFIQECINNNTAMNMPNITQAAPRAENRPHHPQHMKGKRGAYRNRPTNK